jgi:membrane-bound serine protease (ClpP class)
MRRWRTILSFLSVFFLLFGGISSFSAEESYAGKVVVIPVEKDSLTSTQGFQYINRVLKRADQEKAVAVLFDIDTPGGLAWETAELMMQGLYPLHIPSIAYVNTRAISAGALLSCACDSIYMAPVSTIGAAGIVDASGVEMDSVMRQKTESAFTAFARSVADAKGHPVDLIRAMMIPASENLHFGPVKVNKGELLTLTGKEAVADNGSGHYLLAKAIAPDKESVLQQEGINAPMILATPTGMERLALWIAWGSPFLILIGMGAAYIEMKTPGFGLPGAIAIAAFALFFFGNHLAGNLAGYETAILFAIGVILIILEIFVFTGTMIPGIIGAALVLLALFSGMINSADWDNLLGQSDLNADLILKTISSPMLKLTLGIIGGSALIMLLMRYLPETPLFRRISNLTVSGGSESGEAVGSSAHGALIGSLGTTLTELKPNGKAEIDGEIYEVCSRQGLIHQGTPIRVVEHRAFDMLVEVDTSSSPS